MRKLWISDVDGTVALMDGRSPYEWNRVCEDKPNEPVLEVIRAMIRWGHDFGFVSGRMEQCRADTKDWLHDNLGIPYASFALWMRRDGDMRPDEIIKREIYETEIAPYYEVMGVFDDRAKVVAMWRSLGLTCLAVAEGNF